MGGDARRAIGAGGLVAGSPRALHGRLVLVLGSLDAAAFARTLFHPERGPMSIDDYLALYDWHSRHHTAHITSRCGAAGLVAPTAEPGDLAR